MTVAIDMNIIITYSLSVIVAIHSYKFRGLYKTLIFFFGSVLISGGLENMNSLYGGYHYPEQSQFTLFLFRCPFDICLGWFVLLHICSYFAHIIIGKGRGSLPIIGLGSDPTNGIDKQFIKDTILRAALAGVIAVNFDMFVDPVATTNGWWFVLSS